MIDPHGGVLINRLVTEDQKKDILASSLKLPKINLTSQEVSDLLMISNGSFSPLKGFMGQKDYESVLAKMSLSDGTLWPLPVTLAVSEKEVMQLEIGGFAALIDESCDEMIGRISISDIFTYNHQKEAFSSFGTNDDKHPGVAKLLAQKPYYVGGEVEVLTEGIYAEKYPEYARPSETRAIFQSKDWQTVAAFQTRNPIHRSHEYLTKIALEICDGLLIHPVVGALKKGDIPADVRLNCYRTLLASYYPKERTILKVYPMEMRYAGPREALLHAIIRQNFGCTHIIIGRDHAGVGDYYGPFDAQKIFDKIPEGSLQISPLKIDMTFWCKSCNCIASAKTCPHDKCLHVSISGTTLREMLSQGKRPPSTITRPEVADILINYYQSIEPRPIS